MNEMSFIPVFWHWWALAALLLVIELLEPGLYFLWLGVAALVTGMILLISPGLDGEYQLAIFSLLSVVSIVVAQRYLKHHEITSDQPLLNRRTARYVGRIVRLDQPIIGGKGRINLDGSIWNIIGEDSPINTPVKITGVDGITLEVERVESFDGSTKPDKSLR